VALLVLGDPPRASPRRILPGVVREPFRLRTISILALSISRSVKPVTLRLLLRCRSCEASWASKALAGVLAWSDLQRQQGEREEGKEGHVESDRRLLFGHGFFLFLCLV
jgi:hypothetical protein